MQADLFTREDRELQFVPRWCIVRTLRQQSVAEHSYYVALWADRVARAVGITDSETLYKLGRKALVHDLATEIYSGDIPATFKRQLTKDLGRDLHGLGNFNNNPVSEAEDINVLSEHGVAILKVADLIEALVFLFEEQQLGNQALFNVVEDIKGQLSIATRKLSQLFTDHEFGDVYDFISELRSVHWESDTNNIFPNRGSQQW